MPQPPFPKPHELPVCPEQFIGAKFVRILQKHLDKLRGESPHGALMQLYATIVGVMLMYLHTGYRPSKYLFALLSSGAGLDELMPILRERERRSALDRESQRRRAEKKRAAKNGSGK